MKVGINLELMRPGIGGIGHFMRRFLREWPRQFPDDPLTLYVPTGRDPAPGAKATVIRFRNRREIHQHLREVEVFFAPFAALLPRPVACPSVVLCMDLQEQFFPEFFTRRELRDRLYHTTWSLRLCDRAIAISEYARGTFTEKIGLPPEKVSRVYLSADELPEGTRPGALPAEWTDFAYYPANNWPHKNHRRLFQALRKLQMEGLSVPLVLTGSEQPNAPRLADLARDEGVQNQVAVLGERDRAEVAWLYRHARLLVHPSLFEGFGMPLVEAMQSGLPVACANATSLPEVGGDAAILFDPLDVSQMAGQVQRLWTDEALRAQLISTGHARAREFSFEASLCGIRDVLEQARAEYDPAHLGKRRRQAFCSRFIKQRSAR